MANGGGIERPFKELWNAREHVVPIDPVKMQSTFWNYMYPMGSIQTFLREEKCPMLWTTIHTRLFVVVVVFPLFTRQLNLKLENLTLLPHIIYDQYLQSQNTYNTLSSKM